MNSRRALLHILAGLNRPVRSGELYKLQPINKISVVLNELIDKDLVKRLRLENKKSWFLYEITDVGRKRCEDGKTRTLCVRLAGNAGEDVYRKEMKYESPHLAMEIVNSLAPELTPYAYFFVSQNALRVTETTGLTFIGGRILTIEQVYKRNAKDDEFLLKNMKEGRPIIVENHIGTIRVTQEFCVNDVVLDPKAMKIIERGDTPSRIAYRRHFLAGTAQQVVGETVQ